MQESLLNPENRKPGQKELSTELMVHPTDQCKNEVCVVSWTPASKKKQKTFKSDRQPQKASD
ncbi:hypothetical protein GC174_15905 [bacterium]|nr:hypothetical protein [bacterium]